ALGLLVGFAGPVLASSSLIAAVAVGIFDFFGRETRRRRNTVLVGVFCAAVLVGALVAQFSPGSQLRSSGYRADHSQAPTTLVGLIKTVFPSSYQDWWQSIFNGGSAVVCVLVAGFVFLLIRAGLRVSARTLFVTGCSLLAFSLVASVMNRLSEVFVYKAWWHMVAPSTVTFIAICILAAGLGMKIAERLAAGTLVVPLITAVVAVLMVVPALSAMVGLMKERAERWETGPASTRAIGDIDDWAVTCWNDLTKLRDAPDRPLPRSPTR
ncbi:MAG: hypothetical protein WCI74_03755, partial [Actinomycetes bacterium]